LKNLQARYAKPGPDTKPESIQSVLCETTDGREENVKSIDSKPHCNGGAWAVDRGLQNRMATPYLSTRAATRLCFSLEHRARAITKMWVIWQFPLQTEATASNGARDKLPHPHHLSWR
jgi:hypothetical protein